MNNQLQSVESGLKLETMDSQSKIDTTSSKTLNKGAKLNDVLDCIFQKGAEIKPGEQLLAASVSPSIANQQEEQQEEGLAMQQSQQRQEVQALAEMQMAAEQQMALDNQQYKVGPQLRCNQG